MLSQISTSDFDMGPYYLVILLFLGFSPTLLGYTWSTLPVSSFGLILKLFGLLWFSPGCLSCVFQKVVPKLKFLLSPLATEGGKDPGLFTESAQFTRLTLTTVLGNMHEELATTWRYKEVHLCHRPLSF